MNRRDFFLMWFLSKEQDDQHMWIANVLNKKSAFISASIAKTAGGCNDAHLRYPDILNRYLSCDVNALWKTCSWSGRALSSQRVVHIIIKSPFTHDSRLFCNKWHAERRIMKWAPRLFLLLLWSHKPQTLLLDIVDVSIHILRWLKNQW